MKITINKIYFGGRGISLLSSKKKFQISGLLKNPLDFHGDINVNYLIKFNGIFEKLIGKYRGQFGQWKKDKLTRLGVVILEYDVREARKVLNAISKLAQKLVDDPKLYNDKQLSKEYFDLIKEGYRLLKKYESQFGFENNYIPVSLERAGLVCTRLAKSLGKDAKIKNEIRVTTKRTHLINEPETHLAVTVTWKNRQRLKTIDNEAVELNDTVNPASGASGGAFVIASLKEGVKPSSILHRSIVATRQGILFIRKAFKQMNIETKFYSLGECDELNSSYYLVGKNMSGEKRIVADAGHILRYFLPNWYKP